MGVLSGQSSFLADLQGPLSGGLLFRGPMKTILLVLVATLFASAAYPATINMQVGQSYTYDLNSTVPAIPSGTVANVTANVPSAVQITKNADNTGSVKGLTAHGGVTITYAVPGYTSTLDLVIIANPPPAPPVLVVRGPVTGP